MFSRTAPWGCLEMSEVQFFNCSKVFASYVQKSGKYPEYSGAVRFRQWVSRIPCRPSDVPHYRQIFLYVTDERCVTDDNLERKSSFPQMKNCTVPHLGTICSCASCSERPGLESQ